VKPTKPSLKGSRKIFSLFVLKIGELDRNLRGRMYFVRMPKRIWTPAEKLRFDKRDAAIRMLEDGRHRAVVDPSVVSRANSEDAYRRQVVLRKRAPVVGWMTTAEKARRVERDLDVSHRSRFFKNYAGVDRDPIDLELFPTPKEVAEMGPFDERRVVIMKPCGHGMMTRNYEVWHFDMKKDFCPVCMQKIVSAKYL